MPRPQVVYGLRDQVDHGQTTELPVEAHAAVPRLASPSWLTTFVPVCVAQPQVVYGHWDQAGAGHPDTDADPSLEAHAALPSLAGLPMASLSPTALAALPQSASFEQWTQHPAAATAASS